MDGLTGAAGAAALPADAPLAMPVQSLRAASPRTGRPTTELRAIGLRRAYVVLGAVAMTVAGGHEMYRVLDVGGLTVMECLILALYVALFAWIALAFTSALAGFFAMLAGGGLAPGVCRDGPLAAPALRTALLMPRPGMPMPSICSC
jgi:membrane glycosyltransferase